MEAGNDKHIEVLAEIMRALADVWPNDRDGVMIAGSKFEQSIDELNQGSVQLKKLIELAWQGMRHLYEEDDYFYTVKNATLHSVNTIREYHIQDGNITIENFEKACDLLEKALSGDGESADKIIDLENIPGAQENNTESVQSEKKEPARTVNTLNDLAILIMEIGETADKNELEILAKNLQNLAENYDEDVKIQLKEALGKVEEVLATGTENGVETDWYDVVSEKTETAIRIREDQKWNEENSSEQERENSIDSNETADEAGVIHGETSEIAEYVIPEDIDLDMVKEFIAECTDLIEIAESALLDLEDTPKNEELINAVFRAFHTIKGTSAFMGLDPITEFTHSAETLLSMIRDGEMEFDRACADISLTSIDIIKKFLAKVGTLKGGDPLPATQDSDQILRVLNHISEEGMKPADALVKEGINKTIISESEVVEFESADNESLTIADSVLSGENGAAEENGVKNDQEATVRVNLGRLDRLIDMVGELVIAHSVVSQDSFIAKDVELMKKVDHTSKILRELQDTSLTLRMVPLKATFQKMNRLVRDLARKAGKQVKFSTLGDDTEIDRNMVDIINEPLVHMLRNSIDHGVETPEERSKTGKPSTATIWLRAYQEGGKVVIEIEDDGNGINKDKVLQKAIEKGLVNQTKKLTDNEICGLIFHPGLSSVDKVTDLSGRGVGMDVVKRSIEQLQGKVEVESEQGKGTKISLELPFTLAITDGMLVSVGSQRFIIPTISIDMTFRAKSEEIFTILESHEHVKFQGNSVPVIRLHKLFGIPDAIENLTDGTLIVVKINNKMYSLLVDEIIGQQQLVGKSINMNVKMPHISGGAILGDGQVGLILDTAAVVF